MLFDRHVLLNCLFSILLLLAMISTPLVASDSYNEGIMKLVELHRVDVFDPSGELYISGNEIIYPYYEFVFWAGCLYGLLDDLTLNITSIMDMPTYLNIPPIEKGDSWMAWMFGDIQADESTPSDQWKEGEATPVLEWVDKERTYDESLGFSILRDINPINLPSDTDTQVQEVIIVIEPIASYKFLEVIVDYDEAVVQSRLISFEAPQNVDVNVISDDFVSFNITNPSIGTSYKFLLKFELTRRAEGNLRVMPRTIVNANKDSNWIRLNDALSFSGSLEIATVKVTTSSLANWLIYRAKFMRLEIHAIEEVESPTFTIPAKIDIDPNKLKLRSGGKWITCYIELPQEYNPAEIYVPALLLIVKDFTFSVDINAPSQIVDYDNDGIEELMIKFKRADILDWIKKLNIDSRTEIEFTIKGVIIKKFDDSLIKLPFEGIDVVTIIP